MAFGVTFTRTTPLFPRGVFLQWDLVNPTEVGDYEFAVARSGSPSGPWDSVVTGLVNTYNYRDQLDVNDPPPGFSYSNQLTLARTGFYQVTVTAPSGATAVATTPVEPYLEPWQRLRRRKMLRDFSLVLQRLEGVEVAVCKRQWWGPTCTCVDPYTREVVRPSDPACFGTGFQPGYFTPIVTWAKRAVAPVETQLTPEGKTDLSLARVTLLDTPYVQEGDLLVFLRDNRRFVVQKQAPLEIRTLQVYQNLVASELARDSILYRLAVDPLRSPPLF